MKKLMVIMLVLAIAPVMALEWGGKFDLDYFMMSKSDTDDGGSTYTQDEINESFFGEISTKIWATQDLGNDINGKIMLNASELSDGEGTNTDLQIEEMWVAKKGAFNQEALSIKFGKMEIPFNLDYDTGITHTFTNGSALVSSGIGEVDRTWGLTVGYDVEGVGKFSLSTFEGEPGVSIAEEDDNDTGLFSSIILQWDTGKGKDAFDVPGLRLVVAYSMRPNEDDADGSTIISIGGTYTGVDKLTLGLEIDMTNKAASGPGVLPWDEEGAMLIALNADYQINEEVSVGLSYEQLAYNAVDDMFGAGLDMEANTDTRIALRGEYAVADATKLRFEYSMVNNSSTDITEADTDTDGDEDDPGYSIIALGVLGKF